MTTTPVLAATELTSGQAIPETTVNQNSRRIEQGAHSFSVKDKDLTAPPGSPADGDAYLVAASPTGAWSGKAANIVFDDAPIDQAVEGIVNGIFFNQGHVCCEIGRAHV